MSELSNLSDQLFIANVKLIEINKTLVDALEWIKNKAHTHVIHGDEKTDWKLAMKLIEGNARIALDEARIQMPKTGEKS